MGDAFRKLNRVIEPDYVIEGAGVLLRRSFGPSRANPFDPFLLFDHFAFNDPLDGPIAGFPMHPHRGIETVTYMLEGNTRHRDSLGNSGVIGPGDVQWMTSGGGIMHEEMPKRGASGRVDGFQLWVNLPAAEKLSPPRYRGITTEEIPAIQADGVFVRAVAGAYDGVDGAVTEIAARPIYMDITLSPTAEFELPIQRGTRPSPICSKARDCSGWMSQELANRLRRSACLCLGMGIGCAFRRALVVRLASC